MTSLRSERPLRAVIVDDEPLARDCVRLALAAAGGIDVVAECADGPSAVTAIRHAAPDLVFLDVQMPGMSGFDVVREVGVDEMPVTVFVTAYDAYAIDAFNAHALDYVLKPFDDPRFALAVERAREQVRLADRDERDRRLVALLTSHEPLTRASEPAVARFMVKSGDRFAPVRADDVDWFESSGNYVVLHTRTGKHRIRMTLRDLAERLPSSRFVRVHRSAVVNIDRIREIQPWFSGDFLVILHSGDKIKASRTYAPALLEPVQPAR